MYWRAPALLGLETLLLSAINGQGNLGCIFLSFSLVHFFYEKLCNIASIERSGEGFEGFIDVELCLLPLVFGG